ALGTLLAATAVVGLGRLAHSSWAGYGYGGLIFLVITWPLGGWLWRHTRLTSATWGQTLLLVAASLAMGSAATHMLGFNPQAGGLSRLTPTAARQLLWQFPLVLPVENLVLLGGLIAVWQWVRPRGSGERLLVALVAALLFGLWHVPSWGGWTMLVIGLTVWPWTIYLFVTGDMLAPILAHVLLDVLAVLQKAWPVGANQLLWPGVILALLVFGLVFSLWFDWHRARLRL
ncbi:MAG: CPBP family glutamic-type intramembrane protease, partial [Sulfobacillus sp.]|nr:CPBP family glutamic-type intramembrane protease [Sulfobacillus sp.]